VQGYGAAAITRLRDRLRISWQDDNTMTLEYEAGSQTRLFHFRAGPPAAAPPAAPSWQGVSVAQWRYTAVPPRSGELKVFTNRPRAGYLRKNGVPYSANATLTGVLPAHRGAEQRCLAHHRDRGHRSRKPAAAVRAQHALQEAARRRTLLRELTSRVKWMEGTREEA
jgi:hypothetical protein